MNQEHEKQLTSRACIFEMWISFYSRHIRLQKKKRKIIGRHMHTDTQQTTNAKKKKRREEMKKKKQDEKEEEEEKDIRNHRVKRRKKKIFFLCIFLSNFP